MGGTKTFLRIKKAKGGDDFLDKFFPKTRPRYPGNFDRSLLKDCRNPASRGVQKDFILELDGIPGLKPP